MSYDRVTAEGIAQSLRNWYENEPKPAEVIDLAAVRRDRERAQWLAKHTRPMPGPGEAA